MKPSDLIFPIFFICLWFSSISYGQTVKVVDQNNDALYKVSIFNESEKFYTETDIEGNFKLPDFTDSIPLSFSLLGYDQATYLIKHLKQIETITLKAISTDLEMVTVVGRRDERLEDMPYAIKKVDKTEIEHSQSQTSADLLEKSGAVFVQKSQMGGGSPILRGFEANRILLVVDGVRMNNAIYRNGHLQNAITIDQGILEQVEVIFGPGSLTYGSDALGGVIHYRTRDPKTGLQSKPFEANFYTRYATANNEKSVHADFLFSKKKWGFLTSITYADYGNLRAGNIRDADFPDFGKRSFYVNPLDGNDEIITNEDPNVQIGTAYQQIDLLQKIKFKPNNKLDFTLNLQYSTSSDIPRYDRLTETRNGQLRFAEWYYGPQERFLASFKTQLIASNALFDRATLITAFQAIGEDRLDRRLNNPWREASIVDVNVYSANLDFDKYLNRTQRQKLSYGLELVHNTVASEAFRTNIQSQQVLFDVNPRYPSGSNRLTQGGAYLNYEWRQKDSSLLINAGLRYSFNKLFTQFEDEGPIAWPNFYLNGLSSNSSALTWAVGGKYRLAQDWEIRFLAASAFRAPNIDDFSKIRENNGFVTVPNPDLGAERTKNIELGIQHEVDLGQSRLWWTVNAFHTWLNNVMVRSNFALPNGATYFMSRGDSLIVQANINADEARIMGLSAQLKLEFNENWSLFGNTTFTKGERTLQVTDPSNNQFNQTVPLDHIPPTYGQLGLSFTKNKFKVDAIYKFNRTKQFENYAVSGYFFDENNELFLEKEGTADNIELGLIVPGSDNTTYNYLGVQGWSTLNIYTTFRMNKIFSLNLSLENIFDINYRTFASGISAPGRNFIVALRGKI